MKNPSVSSEFWIKATFNNPINCETAVRNSYGELAAGTVSGTAGWLSWGFRGGAGGGDCWAGGGGGGGLNTWGGGLECWPANGPENKDLFCQV